MSKSLKTTEKNEVAKPAEDMFGDYADHGTGYEEIGSDDMAIPFLDILQSNSAIVEDDETGNAKPGLIYNSVSCEFSSEIIVVPVFREVKFVEWGKRDSGGGLVAVHHKDSQFVKDAIANNNDSKMKLESNGNDLVETHYIYVLILEEDGQSVKGFGILPASATKITPVKRWISAMMQIKGKPPIFANRAVIKSEKKQNDKGKFFVIKAVPFKSLKKEDGTETPSWKASLLNPGIAEERVVLDEAVLFKTLIEGGEAKVDHAKQQNGAAATTGTDDIPF